MNKVSAYHRVKSNMRYFNGYENQKEQNRRDRYMNMSDSEKIERMKTNMNVGKFTMLAYTLMCGGFTLVYIIYLIFGNVDSFSIEDTLPVGITSVLVTLLCWWLFKSIGHKIDKKNKILFGFTLEEIENKNSHRKYTDSGSSDSDYDSDYEYNEAMANQDKYN